MAFFFTRMSNKNSSFYLFVEYVKYRLKSNNAHGLHSPFIFNLYNEVFKDQTKFYCFDKIENLRNELKLNFEVIELEDYGAGSRSNSEKRKSIADIANSSLTKPKYAQLLFRLVNYFQPTNIVELGSSLGLTTSYLASVSKSAEVYSFEGDKSISKIASNNFKSLQLNNINLNVGEFSKTLKPWLDSIDDKLDFIFLDGNHRYESTIEYFELFLPHIHSATIMVLDDIRWSNGMERAWKELIDRSEVGVSVDVFQFGLLFFKKDQVKENFTLRY